MNIATTPNQFDLPSAIEQADIRVLLMVLVHMTGDMRWMEPPYTPRRDVRLIPDPRAGLRDRFRQKSGKRPSKSCAAIRNRSSPIRATT